VVQQETLARRHGDILPQSVLQGNQPRRHRHGHHHIPEARPDLSLRDLAVLLILGLTVFTGFFHILLGFEKPGA
jgi:hypothetical protein